VKGPSEADLARRNLVLRRTDPLNCEVRINGLTGGIVVSNEAFYIRNHFPTPAIDPTSWRLRAHGLLQRPLELSLDELIDMPAHTMLLTLECAGNGRSFFDPPIEGEPWALGAVSTAEWTGVLLSDLIEAGAPSKEARELVFRGADTFERSLGLPDARMQPVLLAYAMNGEPLPVDHGYPLRVVVPGWYSVTGVKWLTEIEAIAGTFEGYFQRERYNYELERDGKTTVEPVRHQRVRSMITHPAEGEVMRAGKVTVRGLAWSGEAPMSHVEVSAGGGRWDRARLTGEAIPYCWRRWELTTDIPRPGTVTIRSRATDSAGNTQPERAEWNRLGYGNNSIQEVRVVAG
jgi:DMSO/TMAO reductase YedYZ molybdopterin-dependent catalytic subunit